MTSWQSGSDGSPFPGELEHGHSRRDFLKYSMAGAALLGTGGALSACSSSPSSTGDNLCRQAQAWRDAAPRRPGRSE